MKIRKHDRLRRANGARGFVTHLHTCCRAATLITFVASLMWLLPASAQPSVEASAGAEETRPAAMPAAEQSITALVRVMDDEGRPQPAVPVEVSIIRPPHEIMDTIEVQTDEAGVARLQLPVAEGMQAFFSAQLNGSEVFAASGIDLATARDVEVQIQGAPEASSASSVFAGRLVTIVELWEDYIMFTQIWTLQTDDMSTWRPSSDEPEDALRFPLPEDAAGIRVVQPQEGARVGDGEILYSNPVRPAGQGDGSPSLVFRYSLRHDNARRFSFTQPLSIDVENASVVVPQTTNHSRHPRLNVGIDVPLCEQGGVEGRMCFEEVTNDASGVQMLQGVAVRVARGGRADAGDELYVLTEGWPRAGVPTKWFGLGGVVVGLLFALAALWWERSRRRSLKQDDEESLLVAQRRRLLDEALELEQRLAAASILELDYEVERERIIEDLAVVERRLRELQGRDSVDAAPAQ